MHSELRQLFSFIGASEHGAVAITTSRKLLHMEPAGKVSSLLRDLIATRKGEIDRLRTWLEG